jgi:hypothetical protein
MAQTSGAHYDFEMAAESIIELTGHAQAKGMQEGTQRLSTEMQRLSTEMQRLKDELRGRAPYSSFIVPQTRACFGYQWKNCGRRSML